MLVHKKEGRLMVKKGMVNNLRNTYLRFPASTGLFTLKDLSQAIMLPEFWPPPE
jgi:hypothetical protein